MPPQPGGVVIQVNPMENQNLKNLHILFDVLVSMVNGGEQPAMIRNQIGLVYGAIGLLESIESIDNAIARPPRKQAKPGRKASDPESDREIATKVAQKVPVKKVAEDLGISRQSVFKACKRHEKRLLDEEKARAESGSRSESGQTGEYHPTNDQLRAAGVLLSGKRPGNNKADILRQLKEEIEKLE